MKIYSEPCGCNASGPDGKMDLTLKISRRDLVNALGKGHNMGGVVPLTITGQLIDGTLVTGQDCVVIVGAPDR